MRDTMSEADNVQPTVLIQDSETNETSMDAALPQLEPASSEGHHEAEPPCLDQTLEDEKPVEATKLPSQDGSGHATTVTGLTKSQLEGVSIDPGSNENQDGKEKAEVPAMVCGTSPSQAHIDSPQNLSSTSAVALGPCTSALNGGKENPQCNLEGDPENKQEGGSDVTLADVTAVTEEEEEELLPPKKRQRMADTATEQNGTEAQTQPSSSPEDGRKEADSAVASDETGVCGPGCLKSSEDGECNPQREVGAPPPAVCPEQQQTGNLAEAAGLEVQDYVSDSQLNTIALIEDLIMERDLHSSECPDATDLMCGLIRELSSLNQKVMATHRQLENLHRSSKSSRSALR